MDIRREVGKIVYFNVQSVPFITSTLNISDDIEGTNKCLKESWIV